MSNLNDLVAIVLMRYVCFRIHKWSLVKLWL